MRQLNRRSFLKGVALATAATALPVSLSAKSREVVRLAIIGIRSKGADHINTFQKLPDARIVALCDADSDVLRREQQKLDKAGIKTDGYTDMRRVFDRKDIDAVVMATPNHWHALGTVWACQAGKDVYIEKPVSHEVWEGRKAVEAARRYKRIVQAGTQNRSDPALHEAYAWLKAGNLGAIKLARGFCYKRRESIGRVPGAQAVPANLDYNLWCGPAPMMPLMRKSLHYDWHWVWPTGNGDIGNQGIHEMDLCRWAIGQNGLPQRVIGFGGRFGYRDDAETPNTQVCFYDYRPVPIIFEVRGLPRTKGEEGDAMDNYKGARVGVVIECEGGYFSGGGGGGWVFDKDGKRIKQFAGPGGRDHQAHFLKAVKSRKQADVPADILEGHLSSALCHLGNISTRLGRRLAPGALREQIQSVPDYAEAFDRFAAHLKENEVSLEQDPAALGPWLTIDPATERFVGPLSEMGNLLLKRDYREPFVIREKV
jgi:predicted dehydrogenase